MKDVGLVGVPFSGRTTLFTALTRSAGAAGRDNQAVVPVPDARLKVLAGLEGARDIVPAQVRFTDVPGATTPRGLGRLREADALSLVLRAFGADPEPARELADLTAELILADIAVVESALGGARKRARGRGRDGVGELEALERTHASLSEEVLLRDAGLEDEQRAHLTPLAPLTLKPWVVVANLEEGSTLPPGLPPDTLGVWAGIEAETAGMPQEEAQSLLQEFGVP
jgi:ribosome-binding ATPase YchF (GTP1/OBG family)